ncbi:hypothetical protein, partial [Klebsiella pneumoniae]|uniref:hypothetical protein n=1 Tax=Klebsiella pneumoniae TaxID=573 RepID=UPI003B986035
HDLERAWRWRDERGLLAESSALRVFHGPGEGSGALAGLAIDRFGEHFWITIWEGHSERAEGALPLVADFLRAHGARSAVHLPRP